MSKYALYDPTRAGPTPVLGWYDTDFIEYPNLPHKDRLLELNDDQWNARMTRSWGVNNGALVPHNEPLRPTITS